MKNKLLKIGIILAVLAVAVLAMAGAGAAGDVCKIGDTGYPSLQEAVNAAPAGIETLITMTADTSESVTVDGNKDIILNLDGYVIDGKEAGSVLTISSGSKVTLNDTGNHSSTQHTFEVRENGLWVLNGTGSGEKKTVTGGVITSGAAATAKYLEAFRGVSVKEGGMFTMNGGIIAGNCVYSNNPESGGGAGVYNEGTFVMYGGIIAGNYTLSGEEVAGGGVLNNGVMTVGKTAKITGNIGAAEGYRKSNIYLKAGKTVTLGTGSDKLTEGAEFGVSTEYGTGAVTSNGTAADMKYFFSDNDDCYLLYVTDHLELNGKCSENLYWNFNGSELTITGSGDMYAYASYSKIPWYLFRETITSVQMQEGITGICNYAFFLCRGLTSVTIPDGVTSIGDRAFNAAVSLPRIDLPDSVTSIGEGAFSATAISSITIPAGVTEIKDYTFSSCKELTSVTLPDGLTSIDDGAFSASGISSIYIPAKVTSIGSAVFGYCTSLTAITVDSSNRYYKSENGVLLSRNGTLLAYPAAKTAESYVIDSSITTINDRAFSDAENLKSVTFGTNPQIESIGAYAFTGTGITSIVLPESVKEGYTFGGWVDEEGEPAEAITKENAYSKFTVTWIEKPKSSSSVTSFFGEKDGSDFTFDKAVVITKATLPGASSATVTNTSGSGWYTCNLSTDGTNGVAYFQVPLDVIHVKGWTVNDVSMLGCRTTYLTSEGGYAKYSAVINGAGSYTIDFEKDAAEKVVETKPVTETKPVETPVTTTPVTTETPTQTAAKSPFPVLGILAGLGIAGLAALRRP